MVVPLGLATQWILHICAYTGAEADKNEINRDILLMVGEEYQVSTGSQGKLNPERIF
jgi:hypothetical protein